MTLRTCTIIDETTGRARQMTFFSFEECIRECNARTRLMHMLCVAITRDDTHGERAIEAELDSMRGWFIHLRCTQTTF